MGLLAKPDGRRAANTALYCVRARRLEDRIRSLCAHALVAQEPELNVILSDLQGALHEHAERLRTNALARLFKGEAKERRHSMMPVV